MKEHKILKHSLLIQEVIVKLNSRFKPNVSMIKVILLLLVYKKKKMKILLFYRNVLIFLLKRNIFKDNPMKKMFWNIYLRELIRYIHYLNQELFSFF